MNETDNNLQSMRTGVGIWNATTIGALVMHGPDAAAFLHNFITADIKRLKVGEGAISIQPDRRGMAEALLTIHRVEEDRYLMLLDAEDAQALCDRIEKFHFSESFTTTNANDALGVLALQGARARKLLVGAGDEACDALTQDMPELGSVAVKVLGVDLRLIKRSLTGGLGYLAVVAKDRVESLKDELLSAGERLGTIDVHETTQEIARIEGGVIAFGKDLKRGALSQELGIQHAAFAYDKGCYVGQEVIARIRTKGEVPYQLFGLTFEEDASVESGDELLDEEGKSAGDVTSATFSPTLGRPIAIARIKKGYQREGITLTHKEKPATIVDLPFVSETEEAKSPLYDKALTLFAQGKDADAISMLEEDLAKHPDNLDGWEALGVIQDRLGSHKEAIEAMKKIVAVDEQHLMANVNLSMFYMKIGDKETAEEFQAKATRISLDKRMAEARASGKNVTGDADAEKIKKLEDRIEKFKAIIDMDPEDVLGYFGAGKALLDLKRFREASEMLAKVVEIQEDYSVAWANLGAAYAALGENDKARDIFERGIEVAKEKGDMMPARDMQVRLERLPA